MAHILVAVDGSASSRHAVTLGASLATPLGVGVTLLHAVPPDMLPLAEAPGMLDELQEARRAKGRQLLAASADELQALGVVTETELAVGDTGPAILQYAEAADVRLVVMGTRGHGTVARLLLGSVATHVIHHSLHPVIVCHGAPREERTPRKLLVAVDGSPIAREAARVALELAERLGARTTLLHVLPPTVSEGAPEGDFSAFERACEDSARRLLAELTDCLGREAVNVDTALVHGAPAPTILQAAEQLDVDLVVLGTRARGALARTLLGSVADELLHRCTRPVMVVPEGPVREQRPEGSESEEEKDSPMPSLLGNPT